MKTLVIKHNGNSFERYFTSKMQSDVCEVRDYDYISRYSKKKSLSRLIDYIGLILNGSLRKKLDEYSTIILFGERSLIPLVYFTKRKKAKLVFWQWNIVEPKYAKKLNRMKKFCEIWTFDRNDAEKYRWNLNTQFYCPTEKIKKTCVDEIPSKALFVGVDKGRSDKLVEICEKIKAFGIECCFYVKSDNTSVINDEENIKFIKESIDYEKYLEMVENAEILIELVQKNQAGLTLRALEAIFYNKKLLTNNREIQRERFYDPNNIFIIGNNSWEDFKEFLQSPIQPVSPDILEEYSVENWLANFRN